MSIFGSNNNDIFRTQADPRFNSFAEPMNGVNMNSGAWGVDSNYLTPPYLSPFRPRYQGPTGNSYSGFRPSWATSVNQAFNPFASGGDNYGGNFMQQNSPYFDSMPNAPVQGAMSFAQNLAVPGIAAHMAYKYWGGPSTQIGRSIGERLVGGAFSGFGVAPSAASLAPNFVGPMTPGMKAATMGIRGGGALGGLVGGAILPMGGVMAASWAADKAIFDPYIAQRNMQSNFRDNFQGVTFGEGAGSLVTGGGLSRGTASRMSTGLSIAGAKDRTFDQHEMGLIGDYASRSGMLDNAMPDQMVKRIESISKQMKVVMAIANSSDFKEVIEMMSKLQMSGVSSPMMNGFMGALGSSASIAGQSVQKLMNTVGAQGQYLFGAQGLTPSVGIGAAFNAAGSMFAAQRSGLLSPALLARMGGAEGATQSSVAGMVGAYRTPYAGMSAFNQYMGGGATGDVLGNVSRFGGAMVTGNPLQNYGRFQLSEGALTSRSIQDKDIGGVSQHIYELAKISGIALNRDGKVDAGTAHLIMQNQMGLSADQSQALLARMHAYNDPRTVQNMLAGNSRGAIDSLMKYQQQEGLNKGFMTPIIQGAYGIGMGVQEVGSRAAGVINEGAAALGDWAEKRWVGHLFGFNGQERSLTVDQLDKTSYRGFDTKSRGALSAATMLSAKTDNASNQGRSMQSGQNKLSELDKITEAAKGTGKMADAAKKFLSGNAMERKDAAYALATGGVINREYANGGSMVDTLAKLADSVGVIDIKNDSTKTLENTLGESLNKVLAGKDVKSQVEYMTLMSKIETGDVSADDKAAVSRLTGKSIDSLDDGTLKGMAKDVMTQARESGAWAHIGGEGSTLKELVDNNEGIVLGGSIKTGLDPKASRAQMDAQMGYLKQHKKISQMAKENKIDTNAAMGAINALDTGAAVDKFDKAVDKFVGKVEGGSEKSNVDKVLEFMSKSRNYGRPVTPR